MIPSGPKRCVYKTLSNPISMIAAYFGEAGKLNDALPNLVPLPRAGPQKGRLPTPNPSLGEFASVLTWTARSAALGDLWPMTRLKHSTIKTLIAPETLNLRGFLGASPIQTGMEVCEIGTARCQHAIGRRRWACRRCLSCWVGCAHGLRRSPLVTSTSPRSSLCRNPQLLHGACSANKVLISR